MDYGRRHAIKYFRTMKERLSFLLVAKLAIKST
jgi:hypothetical protein